MDGNAEFLPADLLMIILDIQNPLVNTDYDYIQYVIDRIHHGLMSVKESKSPIEFMHYSLLMHLIMFFNINSFDLNMLKPSFTFKDQHNPVQLWVRIWNSTSNEVDFCVF